MKPNTMHVAAFSGLPLFLMPTMPAISSMVPEDTATTAETVRSGSADSYAGSFANIIQLITPMIPRMMEIAAPMIIRTQVTLRNMFSLDIKALLKI